MCNKKQLITIALGTCLLSLLGCGGGSGNNNETGPNNSALSNNTTVLPTTLPQTATTVAATGHEFLMFNKQSLELENTSSQRITLVVLSPSQSTILKVLLEPYESMAVDLEIPKSNDGYTIIWSGYDESINNYNSVQNNVSVFPDSIIFNDFTL